MMFGCLERLHLIRTMSNHTSAANKSFHLAANAMPFFEVCGFKKIFSEFNAVIVNVAASEFCVIFLEIEVVKWQNLKLQHYSNDLGLRILI